MSKHRMARAGAPAMAVALIVASACSNGHASPGASDVASEFKGFDATHIVLGVAELPFTPPFEDVGGAQDPTRDLSVLAGAETPNGPTPTAQGTDAQFRKRGFQVAFQNAALRPAGVVYTRSFVALFEDAAGAGGTLAWLHGDIQDSQGEVSCTYWSPFDTLPAVVSAAGLGEDGWGLRWVDGDGMGERRSTRTAGRSGTSCCSTSSGAARAS